MSLFEYLPPALLQEDPTLYLGPLIFKIFIWVGIIAVGISIVVILGILFTEYRRKKIW